MPYDAAVAAQTPLAAALERVGDRWSLLLIEALLEGPRRFGELSDAVEGIAPNILSERLKRLIGFLATTVAAIMAIDATFGALNTMYTAVATRARRA